MAAPLAAPDHFGCGCPKAGENLGTRLQRGKTVAFCRACQRRSWQAYNERRPGRAHRPRITGPFPCRHPTDDANTGWRKDNTPFCRTCDRAERAARYAARDQPEARTASPRLHPRAVTRAPQPDRPRASVPFNRFANRLGQAAALLDRCPCGGETDGAHWAVARMDHHVYEPYPICARCWARKQAKMAAARAAGRGWPGIGGNWVRSEPSPEELDDPALIELLEEVG